MVCMVICLTIEAFILFENENLVFIASDVFYMIVLTSTLKHLKT